METIGDRMGIINEISLPSTLRLVSEDSVKDLKLDNAIQRHSHQAHRRLGQKVARRVRGCLLHCQLSHTSV